MGLVLVILRVRLVSLLPIISGQIVIRLEWHFLLLLLLLRGPRGSTRLLLLVVVLVVWRRVMPRLSVRLCGRPCLGHLLIVVVAESAVGVLVGRARHMVSVMSIIVVVLVLVLVLVLVRVGGRRRVRLRVRLRIGLRLLMMMIVSHRWCRMIFPMFGRIMTIVVVIAIITVRRS